MKTANSFSKSLLDIGSADRNGIYGKIIHTLQKTGLVDCQRTLQESMSGKSDQTETVTGIFQCDLTDQPFCMIQTGGADILREHTFRHVKNDHQIPALPGIRHNTCTP